MRNLINKAILIILVISGGSVEIKAQTPAYYREYFDTIPQGRVMLKYDDMVFSKSKDSVFVLSRNGRTFYNEDTTLIAGYRMGFMAAKCDTMTLQCDTAHFWATPFIDDHYPFYIPHKLFWWEGKLAAAAVKVDWWSTGSRISSTPFYFIDENTLRVDSIKVFADDSIPHYYDFTLNDVEVLDDGSLLLGGWVFRDTAGEDVAGILMRVDQNMELQWHRWVYDGPIRSNAHEIEVINDRVIVYGLRFEFHPDYDKNYPLRTIFLETYDIENGDKIWETVFDKRYDDLNIYNSVPLLIDHRRGVIYITSRVALKPVFPNHHNMGLYGYTELVSLDTAGNELWSRRYDTGSTYDYYTAAITFSADSQIIGVGKRIEKDYESNDYNVEEEYVIKLNRDDGTEIFMKTYEQTWFRKQFTAGILRLEHGGIITGGFMDHGFSDRGFLQKYNASGCPGPCATVIVREKLRDENNINVYPNPFETYFLLSGIKECRECRIQLIDISGKIQMETAYSERIQTDRLHPGLYLLRVLSGEGKKVYSRKIIKQ